MQSVNSMIPVHVLSIFFDFVSTFTLILLILSLQIHQKLCQYLQNVMLDAFASY